MIFCRTRRKGICRNRGAAKKEVKTVEHRVGEKDAREKHEIRKGGTAVAQIDMVSCKRRISRKENRERRVESRNGETEGVRAQREIKMTGP